MRTYINAFSLTSLIILTMNAVAANLMIKDESKPINNSDPFSSLQNFKCKFEWVEGGKSPKIEFGNFEIFEIARGATNHLVVMKILGTQNFNQQWSSDKLENGINEIMSDVYSEPPIVGVSEQRLTNKKYGTGSTIRFDRNRKTLTMRERYVQAGINAPEATSKGFIGTCESTN